MSRKKGPQFLHGVSDSSLHPETLKPICSSNIRGEKNDKRIMTNTPRFIDRNVVIPTEPNKVVVVDSSGARKNADNFCAYENVQNSQLEKMFTEHKGSDVSNWIAEHCTAPEVIKVQKRHVLPKSIRTAEKENIAAENHKRKRRYSINYLSTRSKTKIAIPGKRRKPKIEFSDDSSRYDKVTSKMKTPLRSTSTQTDPKLSCCKTCSSQLKSKSKKLRPTGDSDSLATLKSTIEKSLDQKRTNVKANDSCPSISLPIKIDQIAEGTLDTKKLYVRHTTDDIPHSKSASKKECQRKGSEKIRTHKSGDLYKQIKRANKNGTVRCAISLGIFVLLTFWLLSAVLREEFLVDLARAVRRYFGSVPVLVAKRKRELTRLEILFQYISNIMRVFNNILAGDLGRR